MNRARLQRVRDVVGRQLAQVDELVAAQQQLRRGLHGLLTTFSASTEPPTGTLIKLIEEMNAMPDRLTTEQRREPSDRRQSMIEHFTSEQLDALGEQPAPAWHASAKEVAEMARRRSAITPRSDD